MNRHPLYDKEYLQELWNKISEDHDRHAYNRLFDYFYPKLFQFSLHFVKLPSIAQEVVSDVVYEVLKDKSRMRSIENISGYLFSAVRNRSLKRLDRQDYGRNSQSIEEVEDYLVQQPGHPETISSDQDLLQLLAAIVNQLPRQRQMVYKLIRDEGLTISEVSVILTISQRTIEKHLELAIKDICIGLKAYLKDQRHHPKIRKMFPRSFLILF